jgi:hypothetical protein
VCVLNGNFEAWCARTFTVPSQLGENTLIAHTRKQEAYGR